MSSLIGIYLFVVGACLGSFVGAMAWRMHERRNVVKERSECEHCHRTLSAKDLFPVLSWVWLRGKCRYCRSPIGLSAVLLEVGLGLAYVGSFVFWPYDWSTLSIVLFALWLVALAGMAFLFIYDARHFLLPDVVIVPLIGAGVAMFILLCLLQATPVDQWPGKLVLGLLPVTGLYGALYVFSKGEWVGLGDIKYGVYMGLVLGWQGALVGLMLANLLGALWVLPGLVRGKRNRNMHVPFGPFLLAATYVAFLWGDDLWRWYFSLAVV